jgi:DNA repair protein radC
MNKKSFKGEKSNLHSGHRQRVRSKFIESGNFDSFTDHEILELLLFYGYPMKDTNEIAHKLLSEYGSLFNLFNRPAKDLINNGGLTENVAVLISMIPYLSRRYLKSEFGDNAVIEDWRDGCKYMTSLVVGQKYESFFVVSLDAKRRVIDVCEVSDGNVSEIRVKSRIVLEKALLNRAKFVIIGHNHPAGTCKPSNADLKMTSYLVDDFKIIGVTVLDHIIVCNNETYSFCKNKLFNFTYNPVED